MRRYAVILAILNDLQKPFQPIAANPGDNTELGQMGMQGIDQCRRLTGTPCGILDHLGLAGAQGLDVDAARLEGLGHLALQLDREQTVLEPGPGPHSLAIAMRRMDTAWFPWPGQAIIPKTYRLTALPPVNSIYEPGKRTIGLHNLTASNLGR